MADCLPYPHQCADGTAYRTDRYCLHGSCRRSGVGRIGNCRSILFGHIHDCTGIQHRGTDSHGSSQWRRQLPIHRQCILPRLILPYRSCCSAFCALPGIFQRCDGSDDFITQRMRKGGRLHSMACLRILLLLCGTDVRAPPKHGHSRSTPLSW